jgi:hypothetical protein
VHAGDLLAEGYDDRLWGEWTDALGFISTAIPSIPVPGNHDLHRPPGKSDSKAVFSVSALWRSHFALPANGPDIEEMRGQSYFVDYQGVRMVALDVNAFANEDFEATAKQRVQEKQLAWLNQVLGTNPNRWTIVVQRQPIYAVAKGREYAEMVRRWPRFTRSTTWTWSYRATITAMPPFDSKALTNPNCRLHLVFT